jgi:HD-GYP domain-containing protein (c-di-GMP phosphodiesterase class II)
MIAERVKMRFLPREALSEEGLLNLVKKRRPDLAAHQDRVSEYCIRIAEHVELSDTETDWLTKAAKMHDVGQLLIRDGLWQKEGEFNDGEREEAKRHARLGFILLRKAGVDERIAKIEVSHHEPDYPRNGQSRYTHLFISKLQKPIEERRKPDGIIAKLAEYLAIADKLDALFSKRPYKGPWTEEETRQELIEKFPQRKELIEFLVAQGPINGN